MSGFLYSIYQGKVKDSSGCTVSVQEDQNDEGRVTRAKLNLRGDNRTG